jgi:hypothetical protein
MWCAILGLNQSLEPGPARLDGRRSCPRRAAVPRRYPARWIAYDFQAEHLLYAQINGDLAGLQPPPFGMNRWKPVSISDIYRIAHNNPALTLYLPDICGPVTVVGDDIPPAHPGHPIMTRPR